MLYSILLIFIFSCSQPSFVYRMAPGLGSITKLKKENDSKPKPKISIAPIKEAPFPLHTAVCKNELNWVQAILAQDKLAYEGKQDKSDMQVNRKDPQGYLPIHWAVGKKISYKNKDAVNKAKNILQLLLPYPNSSQRDNNGMTILHWVTKSDSSKSVELSMELMKLILKEYRKKLPHFINQKDNDGFTALHYAVDKDKKEQYSEK